MKLALIKGNGNLRSNSYSIVEQDELYGVQLEEVLARTRWYLDNLDSMQPYFVSWKNYGNKNPVLPYEYTEKGTVKETFIR